MKILYIPLDERPCNNLYPFNYFENTDSIQLISLPSNLLGYKKNPANIKGIWEFIFKNLNDINAIVGSFDTLIYGSLLNSRLHQNSFEELMEHVTKIKQLKQLKPNLQIYGFSLIMRTPKYNSSDEEPNYYEQYGENIFKRKYLLDKQDKLGLNEKELEELNNIQVPQQYLNDYENRRNCNVLILQEIIKLYNKNIINFMSIPQDDSAKYGYTAIDQKKVFSSFKQQLNTYSGADEAGVAMLARFLNDYQNKNPKFYAFYPSEYNPDFIPMYEDRTIETNLKAHVQVIGGTLTDNINECDYVIAYNITNQNQMCESWEQFDNDSNLTQHNQSLKNFVQQIKFCVNNNNKVIIVDSAYANGGDVQLIKLLNKENLLDKIYVYKGWNTNCNSLGSSLANACLVNNYQNQLKNLALSYYEDVIYQSIVRMNINKTLNNFDANYFDISNQIDLVEKMIKTSCDLKYHKFIQSENLQYNFKIFSPWKRMFELGVQIDE